MALPQVTITDVHLDNVAHVTTTLSAVDPGPDIAAVVALADGVPADGAAGLIVQVGFGPPASDPAPGSVSAKQPRSSPVAMRGR